jgi:hypothetical protein
MWRKDRAVVHRAYTDATHRLSQPLINPRHFPQLRPGIEKNHSLHEPNPLLECTPEQLHLASQDTVGRPIGVELLKWASRAQLASCLFL